MYMIKFFLLRTQKIVNLSKLKRGSQFLIRFTSWLQIYCYNHSKIFTVKSTGSSELKEIKM